MPEKLKVGIVGATGETGLSICNALLSAPTEFEVFAFARSASLQKPALLALAEQGVTLSSIDLDGPSSDVAELLNGMTAVISCLTAKQYTQELNLISAAKEAGVQRYVPSFFGPVVPPRGVLDLRSAKEGFLDHIKKLRVPYTVIDIGWWYQMVIPHLPHESNSTAFVQPMPVIGDGSIKMGLTDNRDIGRFVARIITDERTLNRSVFAYGDVKSTKEAWDDFEEIYGKPFEKPHTSEQDLVDTISNNSHVQFSGADSGAAVSKSLLALTTAQYYQSLAVRGDNTPENAKYLGYLDASELYPDFQPCPWRSYIQELVEGRVQAPYQGRRVA